VLATLKNVIIAGHRRTAAAIKVGIEEIPVVYFGRIGPISGVSAERAGKVVEAIDKLSSKKNGKKAEELRETLNKNIEKAHKAAVSLGVLPPPATKTKKSAKAAAESKESFVPKPISPTPPAREQSTPDTGKPPVDEKPDQSSPPSVSGPAGGEGGGESHFKAYDAADAVVTFLRSRESNKLTTQQKNQWQKIGCEIATYLMQHGIKISATKSGCQS